MTDVITALTPGDDSAVAASLEAAGSIRVVRRCADVAELLSVAGAGVGDCAVLSAGLRGLDLGLVGRLRAAGLAVVGVHDDGDEAAERRLRQLSVTRVVLAGATAEDFERTIGEVSRAVPAPTTPHGDWCGPEPGGSALSPDAEAARPEAARAEDAARWPPDGRADAVGDPLNPLEALGSGDDPAGPDERGRIIAVWGPLGAPGRSTVAVNLAAELASRGLSVLLVDADTYGGCVAQVLGLLDEAPGLAAAARAADQGSLDVAVLARLAPVALPGLRVLTGVPRPDRWPEIGAEALERVLELARSLATTVVVDCGFCLEDDEELSYDTLAPRRNAATLTALAAADLVVAVGAADAVSLQRFVRGLQELGTVPSPTPVPVVNRVRASSVGARPHESLKDVLQRFAGLTAVHLIPEDRDAVDGALLAGRTVVEHAPDSAFRRAVAELGSLLVPSNREGRVSRSSWSRPTRRDAQKAVTGRRAG
jgi:MinD-like ATPase involved in chromosome partitioning or flagellar assembly